MVRQKLVDKPSSGSPRNVILIVVNHLQITENLVLRHRRYHPLYIHTQEICSQKITEIPKEYMLQYPEARKNNIKQTLSEQLRKSTTIERHVLKNTKNKGTSRKRKFSERTRKQDRKMNNSIDRITNYNHCKCKCKFIPSYTQKLPQNIQ